MGSCFHAGCFCCAGSGRLMENARFKMTTFETREYNVYTPNNSKPWQFEQKFKQHFLSQQSKAHLHTSKIVQLEWSSWKEQACVFELSGRLWCVLTLDVLCFRNNMKTGRNWLCALFVCACVNFMTSEAWSEAHLMQKIKGLQARIFVQSRKTPYHHHHFSRYRWVLVNSELKHELCFFELTNIQSWTWICCCRKRWTTFVTRWNGWRRKSTRCLPPAVQTQTQTQVSAAPTQTQTHTVKQSGLAESLCHCCLPCFSGCCPPPTSAAEQGWPRGIRAYTVLLLCKVHLWSEHLAVEGRPAILWSEKMWMLQDTRTDRLQWPSWPNTVYTYGRLAGCPGPLVTHGTWDPPPTFLLFRCGQETRGEGGLRTVVAQALLLFLFSVDSFFLGMMEKDQHVPKDGIIKFDSMYQTGMVYHYNIGAYIAPVTGYYQ